MMLSDVCLSVVYIGPKSRTATPRKTKIIYGTETALALLLPLWAPKRLAPPSQPRLQSADRNVVVGSHGQYVPTLTTAAA